MTEARAWDQSVHSHSLGHDVFEHPRVGLVRVSTIAFSEPVSYDILAAPEVCYEAETIVFVGPHTQARIGGLIRYRDRDVARERHTAVLKRARRGACKQ